MTSHWADKYVGVPYRAEGRDLGGCDCWGLVRLVMRDQAGLDLAAFETVRVRNGARVMATVREEIASGEWLEVPRDEARLFDVVTMRCHFRTRAGWQAGDIHIGICAGTNGLGVKHVLHVEEPWNAVCLPFSHPTISFRLKEIYRHRSLA